MDLVVTLECRFARTPDGKVWQQTQFPYRFWARYLEVFDRVKVVGRIRDEATVPGNWMRCDGEGVSFVAVPYYVGPFQYLLKARQVVRAVRNAVGPGDAVIMRVSSNLAQCLEPRLRATGHPFGVEVVSDPYDALAPGANKNLLRPFFRYWLTRKLREHCRRAVTAAYVTREALQRRYPCPNRMVGVSDAQLDPSSFVSAPRPPRVDGGPLRLIHVGMLDQLYKAQDILIEAVALNIKEGLDLRLALVGDGRCRPGLERRVAELGLQERICFLGSLTSGATVCGQLDQADLFVLPSRQEGLPRAMLEAMARALPCIGSTVGGIPELLPPEDLVPPHDVSALARKIGEVAADPERLARMSARNLAQVQQYREEALREQRLAFYRYVREKTGEWLAGTPLTGSR